MYSLLAEFIARLSVSWLGAGPDIRGHEYADSMGIPPDGTLSVDRSCLTLAFQSRPIGK